MDTGRFPYKLDFMIQTYEGDWTAEQIDAGEAPEPTVQSSSGWYEKIDGVEVEITDPKRIAELEERAK